MRGCVTPASLTLRRLKDPELNTATGLMIVLETVTAAAAVVTATATGCLLELRYIKESRVDVKENHTEREPSNTGNFPLLSVLPGFNVSFVGHSGVESCWTAAYLGGVGTVLAMAATVEMGEMPASASLRIELRATSSSCSG